MILVLQNSCIRTLALILGVMVLSNCASAPQNEPEALAEFEKLNDPIEPTNRAIFGFNQGLDQVVIKPVTGFYRAVTPTFVREATYSFLKNLRSPVILANDFLQGELGRAGGTVVRFFVNSNAGVLGFWDVASKIGFEPHNEDFGQTLAHYGIGGGPYIVLPLLGPSNLRDTTGIAVDYVANPLTWGAENSDTAEAL